MDLETYAGLLRAVLVARSTSGGVPSDAALPATLQRVLFGHPSGEGAGTPGGAAQPSSLVVELLRMPPANRTERLAPLVLECVRGVVEGSVDPDAPLADVGVDSIASTELARLLEAPLGISLPVNLVANFSTPNGIAAHLADAVSHAAPEPSSHTTEPAARASVEAASRPALLPDPLVAPGALPWHVAYDGAELVHGGQVLRIIPREGAAAPAGGDPLVFVHSIVGQIPTPSLKRLQFALGQRELLALTHEGYTTGLEHAFAPLLMREFARKYAISLMGARQMGGFHLMGLSFGATLAQCIAVAAREEGGLARRLILIDPCPPPPHPSIYFEQARSVSLHEAAFNCIFGVIDGSVPVEMIGQVARDLEQMPEDAIPAYVTSHYVRTGGIKGTPWDVMLTARQLRVYRHCALVTSSLEVVSPFEAADGSPSILMVLASKRSEFFAPMHLHDVDEEGRDKLALYGPVVVHHHLEGEHTICCAACVSGRDPVFVEKLRNCLDEADTISL